MLGKFRRMFARDDDREPLNPGPTPGHTSVVFDTGRILLYQADGQHGSLDWAELGSVIVVTSDQGPGSPDLFWLLLSADRQKFLAVPLGAAGEQDLLLAMQMRLRGFRNDAVIDAMASTDDAHFIAWERSDAGASRRH